MFLGLYCRDTFRPGRRHYNRGLDYMAAHDPKAALAEWITGVREDPTFPLCWEMVGDFYAQAHRFEDASAAYHHATEHAPRNGPIFLKLAATLQTLGDQERALPVAQKAVRLMPNDPEALGRCGLLLKARKDRGGALTMLRRAHQLQPENRFYTLALADILLDTLQMGQAEEVLHGYLAHHPDDPEACFRMSVVFNQKPRTPENIRTATGYAQKALAGLPGDPRPYTVLGQLYLDADQTDKALPLYLRGHQVAPTSESVLRGLADCYSRLGRTREMGLVAAEFQRVLRRHDRIDHLTHVMGFNSKDTSAGLELAKLTEEEGLIPRAREYYEQLVRQAPHDPRTRRALSGFYQRLGNAELARRALEPQFVP